MDFHHFHSFPYISVNYHGFPWEPMFVGTLRAGEIGVQRYPTPLPVLPTRLVERLRFLKVWVQNLPFRQTTTRLLAYISRYGTFKQNSIFLGRPRSPFGRPRPLVADDICPAVTTERKASPPSP